MDTTDTQASEFQLSISLGGDAMRTPADIAGQLKRAARRLEEQGASAPKNLIDENGNTVGKWSIS